MKIEDRSSSVKVDGVIEDPDIVSAIQNVSQGQSLEESFHEILLLGAKVKDAVQTTATAQVIEKSIQKVSVELDTLQVEHSRFIEALMLKVLSLDPKDRDFSLALKMKEVEGELKATFTDEQSETSVIALIRDSMESYLQRRESSITKLLSLTPPDQEDPNSVESPLLRLYNHVGEVLQAIGASQATKDAARKTSKKGTIFEDLVFAEVQALSDGFADEADDPGKQKKTGASGNDEGDITVDFKSLGRYSGRLVIECKKFSAKKSKRFLLAELDKGIANRVADYGILVTTESSYEIGDQHPFWEDWDNRRAVVVLQDEDEEIDFSRLRFALLLAKARVREIRNHGDAASFQVIESKIKLLKNHFGRIVSLKGSLHTLDTALAEAGGHVAYLEDNITPILDELEALLEISDGAES
jgi:hypothetical protein